MDSRDRLRQRLLGTGCGACGRPYAASGIRVLAQREDLAFVMLRCESCGSDGLALITDDAETSPDGCSESAGIGPAMPLGATGELTPSDLARLRDQPPIGIHDVLAVRALLAGYRGDLRGLLGDAGRGTADR